MSKKFKNTTLNGYKGEPIKLPIRETPDSPMEIKDAKLFNIFWLVLNSAPLQTQRDSINGVKLATALDETKDKDSDIIEIKDDDVHDWFKTMAEKVTPTLFGINGNIVYKHICEGFEKPHQPQEGSK